MAPNFISSGGKTGGAIYYPFIKDIGIHEMRRRPNMVVPTAQTFSNTYTAEMLNKIVWDIYVCSKFLFILLIHFFLYFHLRLQWKSRSTDSLMQHLVLAFSSKSFKNTKLEKFAAF